MFCSRLVLCPSRIISTMAIEKKSKRGYTFGPEQMVRKPAGFDELPDLVRYDKLISVHTNMSDHMRSSWTTKALQYFQIYMAENRSKLYVLSELGINGGQYDKMEQELLETEGAKLTSMSTAQRYYILMLRNELSLRYLDKFIAENYNDAKMIGAIKVKAQILADMIKIGQDLGIIDKRAKDVRVLGDLNLAVMPTQELANLYKERLRFFSEVISADSRKLTGPHAMIVEQALSEVSGKSEFDRAAMVQDAEYDEIFNATK